MTGNDKLYIGSFIFILGDLMNFSRRSFVLGAACASLFSAAPIRAAVVESIKNAKTKLDQAANQPVKIKVSGKGKLIDNEKDLLAVIEGFRNKIGTSPVMAFGVKFDPFDRAVITYQPRANAEELQTIGYEKGEIEGKPRPFKLLGKAKVADNVFDIGTVKFNLLPALVAEARKRTMTEAKTKTTYGITTEIGQSRTKDNRVGPVRIAITVATDSKSVGYLMASETGEVVEFRIKT